MRSQKREKWLVIEEVCNTFPQAFATTYDYQFANNYYQNHGLAKRLKKDLLIFKKDHAKLCNLQNAFQAHIKEIFHKLVRNPSWAEKINQENARALVQFQQFIQKFKDRKKVDFVEIKNFFTYQQKAHVSAWLMAIVDWQDSLFSNYLKERLLALGLETDRLEVIFSELTTNYPPKSKLGCEVVVKIKQDKKLNQLFQISWEIIKLKRARKRIFNQAFKVLAQIWRQTAKDYEIDYNLVKCIYPWEIDDFLTGRLSRAELFARNRCHIFYSDKCSRMILSGDKAERFIKTLDFHKELADHRVKKLSGSSAHGGIAQGRVKVINDQREFAKVKNGDIIVSHITDPSFLPILKRCAAIVTDLGGITCHAAIVARELEIPCIIGTKVATQVFEDGDLVIVDANKGQVKKLQ